MSLLSGPCISAHTMHPANPATPPKPFTEFEAWLIFLAVLGPMLVTILWSTCVFLKDKYNKGPEDNAT